VKARHEHEAHTGYLAHHFWADGDDLSQPGTRRQPFMNLAMHLTAQTADAPLLILQQKVLTHEPLSEITIILTELCSNRNEELLPSLPEKQKRPHHTGFGRHWLFRHNRAVIPLRT
jgi:hypothetical protein